MLAAALSKLGMASRYLGRAGDSAVDISNLISRGLDECDAVISTGGVSVGDLDLTADALEMSGAEILIKGVLLKPGMACAYGMKDQKPVFALSGNPASAITSFCAGRVAKLQSSNMILMILKLIRKEKIPGAFPGQAQACHLSVRITSSPWWKCARNLSLK